MVPECIAERTTPLTTSWTGSFANCQRSFLIAMEGRPSGSEVSCLPPAVLN